MNAAIKAYNFEQAGIASKSSVNGLSIKPIGFETKITLSHAIFRKTAN